MQDAPSFKDPLIGEIAAGRYKVLRRLGEGGMGRVYLAEHVAIQKQIALKVLRAEYADKGEIVTRFQQEAISASRIKHPNVLDVFDFGRLEDGCFFLAMEYLEGHDLADEMKRRRTLDGVTSVRVALEICRALGAAHAKGVVHRDLKPENVFLQRTDDGGQLVKIVDFGIALLRNNEQAAADSKHRRLTRTGMIFGTPEYMAPEQAAGKHADQRADIYALGIMLYEMCTGAVPFTGETFLSVLARHLSDAPPPMSALTPELTASPQLQAIVFKALAKDPAERYQTMGELAQALAATPEGALVARGALPAGGNPSSGGFVPPSPSNPTAPEFGVVSKPPAAVAASGPRHAATLPRGSGDPARRAETQLGAEAASESARGPRAIGPASIAAGAILTAAALGAFFVFGRPSGTSPGAATTGEPSRSPAVSATPSAPGAALAAASAAPSPSTAAANPGIKLFVATEPEGATLAKNGFQVCDATPCDVLAEQNETLELEAVKGSLRGKARVLAQRDQKVSIKLAGAAPRPPKAASKSPRMCEVEVDGLKILRPCR
ncbi:MAG TPA: protein kinase [Polyangiaceae bacterium]